MAKSKIKTPAKRTPAVAKNKRPAKSAKPVGAKNKRAVQSAKPATAKNKHAAKSAKPPVREADAQPTARPNSPSVAASTFIRMMNIQGS